MRKSSLLAVLLSVLAVFAVAQENTDPLAEYNWLSRLVVVFADSPNDPRFVRQMEFFADDPAALEERDVLVLTDTDPDAKGPLRMRLRPDDFTLVLIDKDSEIVFRKPSPWTVRELSRALDKLPSRLDEIGR